MSVQYEIDPDELTGPASWSYGKLIGVLFLVITSALLLNVFLIAGAAKMYGFSNFPLFVVLTWIFPVSLIGAWFTARWVRRMVENPDEA
ncbi:hypothetical protein [Pseudoprimorskyibacter insulae]|uniref:Uncharacterized protein n=1 Tax=Pseudoprimorskyibacter insulae TaxID=1695997 RepID=A0A2R8AVS9_9RHOB|nr:hypothetical protein [Pseudoprimorskyibacter insulae]SPF80141.1 hypothetical protein PRI8871_01945 [Pseudoprimorskyibacter insulae]